VTTLNGEDLRTSRDDVSAFSALIGNLAVGVLRLDAQLRVVDLNPTAEELLGVARGTACGRPLGSVYRLLDAASRRLLPAPEERLAGAPPAGIEARLLRRDGVELAVRERFVPLAGNPAGGAWLLLEDVTELNAMRREQQWLAFHDPVTGLANRRALERQLEQALAAVRSNGLSFAFGYLDVDDFEVVTEIVGQAGSDDLLRQVANVIRQRLGEKDLLARLAEVRFGLLLADCPPERIKARAQELRRVVADSRFSWHQEEFSLGVSIGMVPVTGGSGDAMKVMAAADAASTMAWEESIAAHAFDADNSIDLSLAHKYGDLRWLARIHRALKKGRFRLYRQPIVPTVDPDPERAPIHEILLRMVEADGSLIAPGEFIPAAERFDLIADLDRWVVKGALARLAADDDERSAIAINLSGKSISKASFLDDVVEIFEASGVAPSRVLFEITETAAVANLRRARRFMNALRARGLRFVLDDFGSGVSSYGYLQNLPVDFLKIDGGFVRGLARNPVQRAIVTAIHQVASVMGIPTIAEYVENEKIRAALAELGVDYVQGYGIRRPAPWVEEAGG